MIVFFSLIVIIWWSNTNSLYTSCRCFKHKCDSTTCFILSSIIFWLALVYFYNEFEIELNFSHRFIFYIIPVPSDFDSLLVSQFRLSLRKKKTKQNFCESSTAVLKFKIDYNKKKKEENSLN